MRNILITNDDGIRSDGLLRLVRSAAAFGQVWVVAPDTQRSAASHSITLDRTIDLFPFDLPVPGVRAFSCTGTPADCVRLGCLAVLPQKPDVVLSGINFGYNSASDLQYSATAGAALEAAFQGVTGIALSEGASDRHAVTDAYLREVLERLIDLRPPEGCIWNVNFPGCPLEQCKGMLENRTVSAESFFRDSYLTAQELPGGGVRLMVKGLPVNDTEEVGTDFRALVDGYVSIGTVNNVGIL
jgi:5'-nucleotidase